jgi:UDP-N-acetylglucosamine 4,6-dehydratase/5-epimerase
MLEGKKILITGGTGSFGQALTERLLKYKVDTIRIFSRNEHKQISMESKFNDDRLRFFIGDVRDFNRLTRALEDVDIVFHAAALKHVPIIEYNPFEAIKTNVIGSQNVIDACLHENIEKAVCIGTDKAVSPLNTYGATKLLMEKLFVGASNYLNLKRHRTKFIALRYGNVLGSSGSVVPKFIEQIKSKKKITITDPRMTRFSITMDEALDFVLESTMVGKGAEVFIPKLRAYTIMDLKQALAELMDDTGEEIVGIRQGEKLHEVLINSDEIRNTWELGNNYVIIESSKVQNKEKTIYPKIKRPHLQDSYSSDKVNKISKNELKKIISKSIPHLLRSDK